MPPTDHKVLINGNRIAKEAILPLGQLTEEAMEAEIRLPTIRGYPLRFVTKIASDFRSVDIHIGTNKSNEIVENYK